MKIPTITGTVGEKIWNYEYFVNLEFVTKGEHAGMVRVELGHDNSYPKNSQSKKVSKKGRCWIALEDLEAFVEQAKLEKEIANA